MEQPKISVIVPVYNAGATIERCVDSILNQSFSDLELLLIDDGSTDRSGELCQKYVRRDPRVRYKWKQNGGVSTARNLGIEEAKGVYVSFVDSDDWLEPDALGALYQAAEEHDADFIMPRMRGVYYTAEGTYLKDVFHEDDFTKVIPAEELPMEFERLFRSWACFSTCGRLYRRSLLVRDSIRFEPDVRVMEDFCFNLDVLEKAQTMVHIDMVAYSYSVLGVENYSYKRNYRSTMEGTRAVYERMSKFLERRNLPFLAVYADLLMSYWVQTIRVVQGVEKKTRDEVLREIAKEVKRERLMELCTRSAVDTHFRTLFQTGNPGAFYAVYHMKQLKKRIKGDR